MDIISKIVVTVFLLTTLYTTFKLFTVRKEDEFNKCIQKVKKIIGRAVIFVKLSGPELLLTMLCAILAFVMSEIFAGAILRIEYRFFWQPVTLLAIICVLLWIVYVSYAEFKGEKKSISTKRILLNCLCLAVLPILFYNFFFYMTEPMDAGNHQAVKDFFDYMNADNKWKCINDMNGVDLTNNRFMALKSMDESGYIINLWSKCDNEEFIDSYYAKEKSEASESEKENMPQYIDEYYKDMYAFYIAKDELYYEFAIFIGLSVLMFIYREVFSGFNGLPMSEYNNIYTAIFTGVTTYLQVFFPIQLGVLFPNIFGESFFGRIDILEIWSYALQKALLLIVAFEAMKMYRDESKDK